MKKPLIGLVANYETYENRPKISVNRAYVEMLARAGAHAVIIAPTWNEHLEFDHDGIAEIVALCDGLVLPGGADVDPALYGEDPEIHVTHLLPDLDFFQKSCFDAARGKMPILGICRGEQLINVAMGGTLIQHLPARNGVLEHCQQSAPYVLHHQVRALPQSAVANNLSEEFRVNSFHHQAVKEVAPGLRATAHASDGIIEAVEGRENGFPIWGLQWHPEGMLLEGHNQFMLPLIQAFVECCKG